jgi:DNA-binding response OmpR family regulator
MYRSICSRRKIVIAEDNSPDVMLVMETLKEYQVNCRGYTLQNGEQALAFLNKPDSEASAWKMDLLVLELNLPKHGGEEMLQNLRSTQHLADTPVILMSALDVATPEVNRDAEIASVCFPKPSTLDEFLRIGFVARELLEGKTGRTAPGSGRTTEGAV